MASGSRLDSTFQGAALKLCAVAVLGEESATYLSLQLTECQPFPCLHAIQPLDLLFGQVQTEVQTQVNAIWQKRLVLENMFPTPPCDPSIDAKSPSGFRSPYGRGCYLLPTSPIKAMPLVLKNDKNFHSQN
jgi:hypothetical protein